MGKLQGMWVGGFPDIFHTFKFDCLNEITFVQSL